MGRLIDADDVKDLINGLDSLPYEDQVDEMVDAIPTAYDLGKVVAELEDAKDCIEEYPYTGARCPNEIEIIELEKAIDIVKRGGRDE